MISTLTLATLSIVTTGALVNSLAAIGVLMLVALLFQKELASAAGGRFKRLSKTLNVAIVPFLMAFVLILASKILEVIR